MLAARGAPGVNTAMQLMMVPSYCIALTQPHATLLFWASSLAGHLALQVSALAQAAQGPSIPLHSTPFPNLQSLHGF